MRASGPGGGWLRQLRAAAAALVGGAVLSFAAAGVLAVVGGPERATAQDLASYVYGVDASVPLAPAPGCAPRVAARQLLGKGAHPAVGDGGQTVWFDAPGPDGRRQIYRLDRASGEVLCRTCKEPGNNRRPRLSANGRSVVFETDRYASAFEPLNVELQSFATRTPKPRPSRRLTFDPGPDTAGSIDPGGELLVWSSGRGGRFAVVRSALRTGHGGIVVADPKALAVGGAAWVAPLAWAPDARTLVVLRGDPFGLQRALAIDPATGHETTLDDGDARVAAASFDADGTLLAVATTRPAAAAAALPAWLGFFVGRIAVLEGGDVMRWRGTGVRIGPAGGPLQEVSLGDDAEFGHPSGIALEPDGRAFVLGQRRETPGGAEERLLRIELDCR